MVDLFEIIKVIFLGIVEGITEWLPISSTGHMLLVDEFIKLNMTEEFKEMFFVVIQLGAILAVVLMFFKKMIPFQFKDKTKPKVKKETFSLWFKVVVACLPGAVITLLFDDAIEAYLNTPIVIGSSNIKASTLVIAATLIIYGIAFIIIERGNKKAGSRVKMKNLMEITYKDALLIGLFQVLSIIPGTSRSGSTIIGALLIGVSRVAAAEFTFFLAVPVMFGLSAIKLLKFGLDFTSAELIILIAGMVTAFLVSVIVIKFLMGYIKKRDFQVFGWYRIALGLIVLVYFMVF